MYTKTTWNNGATPPINAVNLNKMEQGIYDAHAKADANEADIASNYADLNARVSSNDVDIAQNKEDITKNTNDIASLSAGEVMKGAWTPTAGTEYPTASVNWSYYISGVNENGYTFTSGDLTGKVAKNMDKIILTAAGWSLIENNLTVSIPNGAVGRIHNKLLAAQLLNSTEIKGKGQLYFQANSASTFTDRDRVLRYAKYFSGTATSGTQYSLTDATLTLTAQELIDYIVTVTTGAIAEQRTIIGNDTTSVTFDRPVSVTVGATTTYKISKPRFEKEGLLCEPESTNLCLQSSTIDTNLAEWTLGSNTVRNASALPAPDGSNTAVEYLSNGAGNVSVSQVVGGLISGITYTFSMWIRSDDASALLPSTFVLSATSGINSSSLTNADAQINNEWRRFDVSVVTDGTSVTVYLGYDWTVGVYLQAWGAQLEAQSKPTSYIPTTTAPVLRAYQAQYVDRLGNQPNIDDDCTYIIRLPKASVTDSTQYLVSNYPSSNDAFYIQILAGGALRVGTNSNGAGGVLTTAPLGTLIDSNDYIISIKIENGICKIFINGILVTTGTGTHVEQKVYRDYLSIGMYRENSPIAIYNGHIDIDTYDYALTDAEIALS